MIIKAEERREIVKKKFLGGEGEFHVKPIITTEQFEPVGRMCRGRRCGNSRQGRGRECYARRAYALFGEYRERRFAFCNGNLLREIMSGEFS